MRVSRPQKKKSLQEATLVFWSEHTPVDVPNRPVNESSDLSNRLSFPAPDQKQIRLNDIKDGSRPEMKRL